MPGAGNRKRQRRKQHGPVPFECGECLGTRHNPFDKGETCLRLLLPKRQIDISIRGIYSGGISENLSLDLLRLYLRLNISLFAAILKKF